MPRYAQIVGWGKALPSRVMTNDELSRIIDTSDEWIRSRTGIRARRIAGPRETTASLAEQAAHAAIETADIHPAHIDLVIVCTFSPEFGGMPSVASLVQDAIGAERAGAFDINAACAGFMYGLAVAQSMIVSGQCDTVLLIGSETLSRLLDWSDRSTCILFGDGAGAMVLQATAERTGILSSVLGSDGSGAELLTIPAGGSRLPTSPQTIVDRQHYIRMNGREVYKFAVKVMGSVARGSPGAGRSVGQRRRPLHSASGQSPDHRVGGECARRAGRARVRQCRKLWQYERGIHSDRAVRGD